MRHCLVVLGCLLLAGCYSSGSVAPVRNLTYEAPNASGTYRVQQGDTLYSIAWMSGLDYRYLAKINRLPADYTIHPGQVLRLDKTTQLAQAKPRASTNDEMPIAEIVPSKRSKVLRRMTVSSLHRQAKAAPAGSRAMAAWVNRPVNNWRWPARGKLAEGYSNSPNGNKGVDISGHLGEPIHASAAGVVVYSGAGVRGYGNLIIIKHNDSYLSAYAYNRELLVRLGEKVVAGQKIALMGRNNAGETLLHFEIRRNGQPVNPLPLLR